MNKFIYVGIIVLDSHFRGNDRRERGNDREEYGNDRTEKIEIAAVVSLLRNDRKGGNKVSKRGRIIFYSNLLFLGLNVT
jgi:hypothetical protein